jgi:hypothetical protein
MGRRIDVEANDILELLGDCDRELSVTEQPAWRQGRQRGCDYPDRRPDGQRRRQCFGLVRGDAEPAAALARPRLAH